MQKQTQVSELTVFLKGEESSYKQKFLIYDEIMMNPVDPIVDRCIREAKEKFRVKPAEIKIKVVMEL